MLDTTQAQAKSCASQNQNDSTRIDLRTGANLKTEPVGKDTDLGLLDSERSSELIALSGHSVAELLDRVDSLIPIAGRICRAELTDLSASCKIPAENCS